MNPAAVSALAVMAAIAISSSARAAPPPVSGGCCSFPILAPRAHEVADFVPKGWRVEAEARGAVGGDRRTTVVLVLRELNPAFYVGKGPERIDTNPRMLVVAFANSDGSYELALQNHTFMPRQTAEEQQRYDYTLGTHEGRVNIPGVEIAKSGIRLRLNEEIFVGTGGGAAEIDHTYTFRIDGNKLVLIGYDSRTITYGLDVVAKSYNYLARRGSVSMGRGCAGRQEDITARCRFTTAWKTLPPGQRLSIDDIGDGLGFEPDPSRH